MKLQGIIVTLITPFKNGKVDLNSYEHFRSISESTDLDIVIYNIPYRTGVNVENDTIYKLAQLKNIVGIKDCSGNMKQTTKLLLNPPEYFLISKTIKILFKEIRFN